MMEVFRHGVVFALHWDGVRKSVLVLAVLQKDVIGMIPRQTIGIVKTLIK